ncbi:MAG: murein L,D-transpeptidase catalytic domain family protein [Chitinophagales bacterium]
MGLSPQPANFSAIEFSNLEALHKTPVEHFDSHVQSIYYNSGLDSRGLSYNTFKLAVAGYYNLKKAGRLSYRPILTIVDFNQPSSADRIYVVDMQQQSVLFQTLVSHGEKSGMLYANYFSNRHQSHQSSLGFYKTAETYYGQHGYSLKLDGLDRGFNHNARSRGVVVHGAYYVDHNYVRSHGSIGRSWGCPALPEGVHKDIINAIQGGSCMFIYKDNLDYLNQTPHINFHTAANFYLENGY